MSRTLLAAVLLVCALGIAVTFIVSETLAQEQPPTPAPPAQISAPPPAAVPAAPVEAAPVEAAPVEAAPVQPGGPAPKIFCPEPEYNFGERDESEAVEHEFVIQNQGDAPLEITNVKTSCGCTAAKPQDSTVPPGGETKIAAKLSLHGRQGELSKTITVSSNDPLTPNLVLTLKGTVTAPIMYEPRILNFGKVLGGSAAPQKLVLRSLTDDFEVTAVTASLDFVKTEVKEVEPKRVYEVTAHIDQLPAAGQQTGTLTVQTTHPRKPQFNVTIYVEVVGPLDISPPTIALQYSNDPAQKITQVVRVGPGTVKEFEVTEVIVPDERIGVELMPRPQNQFLIKLIDMPRDDSLDGKELIVRTTVPEMPEVRIPFRVIKLGQPALRPPAAVPGGLQRNPSPNAPAQPPRQQTPQQAPQQTPQQAPQQAPSASHNAPAATNAPVFQPPAAPKQ